MAAPGWLTRRSAELPTNTAWLAEHELATLSQLSFAPRREDWLLGRFTAKAALAALHGLAPEDFEVRAAPDGAPEPWRGERRLEVSLSISHRGSRALAVVAPAPVVVGCDLELIEARSGAFVREWLSPPEQALVTARPHEAPLLANLVWTAKEAAAKVWREGLRLDLRYAVVIPQFGGDAEWRSLTVRLGDASLSGWWRAEPGWVMVIAAAPAPATPRPLSPDPLPALAR
jgi:4'-phosphopantetheinyl transferase